MSKQGGRRARQQGGGGGRAAAAAAPRHAAPETAERRQALTPQADHTWRSVREGQRRSGFHARWGQAHQASAGLISFYKSGREIVQGVCRTCKAPRTDAALEPRATPSACCRPQHISAQICTEHGHNSTAINTNQGDTPICNSPLGAESAGRSRYASCCSAAAALSACRAAASALHVRRCPARQSACEQAVPQYLKRMRWGHDWHNHVSATSEIPQQA